METIATALTEGIEYVDHSASAAPHRDEYVKIISVRHYPEGVSIFGVTRYGAKVTRTVPATHSVTVYGQH